LLINYSKNPVLLSGKRLKVGIVSLIILIIALSIPSFSCSKPSSEASDTVQTLNPKVSSILALQINLRKAQLSSPSPENLAQMQNLGMNITSPGIQRIYIYLKQKPSSVQLNELRSLGITIYPDSWIPPVGINPTGFILADLPVDKLNELVSKDYVVKLDTAEIKSDPQVRPDNVDRSQP
jgi:hypothetical protein